jgi:ABC-type sugar transport system permease subunit
MTNTVDVKKTKKKKKAASLEKKKARAGWIFVLPFVIGFVIIYFPIVFESIRASLFYTTKVDGKFVDTFNYFNSYYQAFFHEDTGDFLQTLFSGIGEIVLDIPMILLFSLFMAVLLNQKMAGRAVFRAIFFVPVILSTGIMDSIDASALDTYMESNEGIDDGSGQDAASSIVSAMDVQRLFAGMAIGDGMLKYVTDAINNIYEIVNRSGVQMLIFLSGLQSISPAIYESVQIDGATAWETFWKITFPMISPMILVNAVYTVIDAFTTESTVMTFINTASQSLPEQGLAISTAMSWMYFLIVIAILALIAGVFGAYVFYQKKN